MVNVMEDLLQPYEIGQLDGDGGMVGIERGAFGVESLVLYRVVGW